MSTSSYRGGRNWVPKDDGRKHQTRRTTPTSTSAIRSRQDRFPGSCVIDFYDPDEMMKLGPSVTNGSETTLYSFHPLSERHWIVYFLQEHLLLLLLRFCIAGWCTYRFLEWVEVTNQIIHDRGSAVQREHLYQTTEETVFFSDVIKYYVEQDLRRPIPS
jgi:hypothetical protein